MPLEMPETRLGVGEHLLMIMILCALSAVLGLALTGYVLCQLWSWFAVPMFHLPELSRGYAYGLSLIPTYFIFASTKISDPKQYTDWPSFWRFVLKIAFMRGIAAGMALFFGKVALWWIG